MEKLIEQIKLKAAACGDSTKEKRARKGAYIDCIMMIKQALHKPLVMQAEGSDGVPEAAVGNSAAGKGVSGGINCPNCGNEWDITKHNACQCGAQLRGELLR